jgi:hypothetical protein
MAVNTQKFLPSSKGGALAKVSQNIVKGTSSLSFAKKGEGLAKVSQNIAKGSSSPEITEDAQKNIGIISVKVIEIDKILKGTLASQKKQLDNEKRQQSSQRREKQEEKLETKPDAEKDQIKMPKAPRFGIFDWIKNFIGNIILGYFAVRLVDHLPKIIPIIKFIGSATDLVLGFGGDLLNGLITFVDWGYRAYDFTKNQLKNFGGENFVKVFEAFNGAVGGVVTAALAASFALVDGVGSRDGGGADIKRGGKPKPKVTTTGGRGVGGVDIRSPLRQRPKVTFGGGNKALLSSVKPFTKRLPIIGALLDFGLSVALGEPVGRAAFKAIGAGLLGSIGAALGGPFAILTGIAGGMAGDWAGGALYDLFFGGKKSSNRGIAKAAGGGQPSTRGGKPTSGPSRRVKKTKTKRAISVQPTPIKPGANVGGEKNIEKVFPKSTDKTKVSPLDYVESSYKKISDEPFFGPLMSISTKALVGQKPGKVDYKNAAQGLSNWMNVTFSDEILRTGALYAAGGGEIDADMLSKKSGDMTDAIAKSLEDNISRRVDDTINDLMKQMMLEPQTKPAGVPGPSKPGPEDMINIQGGDADFWTLVAVASREDGDPQAWADVAQSVYNRLASGAYSGKTIKDLILGQMQYEPTWKFPNGTTVGRGKPNPEWYQIKDAASAGAAAGQSEDAMKKVAAALLDPTLQKNAREFIQGRTDFRGYSVSGGAQRKPGDNYFGWYNNYTANKIGSVPNFGATATTTTGVGPGIIGSLGSGYGSEGVKIAGDLGDYMKQTRIPTGSIHQHPRHPQWSRRGGRSYHNSGRAIDLGGWSPSSPEGGGRDEQAPIIKALLDWSNKRGVKPVELIHGSPAFKNIGSYRTYPDSHHHHVHVAFFHGGLVKKTGLHMLHQGEFVVDKDSVDLLGKDFIATINEVENKSQLKQKANSLISVLQNYTDYEMPSPEVVYIPVSIPDNTPEDYSSQSSGGLAMFAGGEADDPFKTLYQGT